ncbi:asparagine synthase-related protein [Staphylococcus pseudintermedius]|uniref:asparagine synthase-related protein n=1 Tax=Staphylococcus pseudintermedius TaxID=283734 RepID=UPI0018F31436|nr:hypothetical protein [Staphylococcus pseudintermedius]
MHVRRFHNVQLSFEDRLALFWGLENRVPFLDDNLVDFSINLSPKSPTFVCMIKKF